MKHKHMAPLNRACEGCIQEAQERQREEFRARVREVVVAVGFVVVVVLAMYALSIALHRHGLQ